MSWKDESTCKTWFDGYRAGVDHEQRNDRPRTPRKTDHQRTGAVERIAAKSAAMHPLSGTKSGGLLGIGEKRDFNALPPVNVTLAGNIASVSLKIGLRFPSDLRAVTEQIRENIVVDLKRLAAVTATPVDIEVLWLENAPTPRRVL